MVVYNLDFLVTIWNIFLNLDYRVIHPYFLLITGKVLFPSLTFLNLEFFLLYDMRIESFFFSLKKCSSNYSKIIYLKDHCFPNKCRYHLYNILDFCSITFCLLMSPILHCSNYRGLVALTARGLDPTPIYSSSYSLFIYISLYICFSFIDLLRHNWQNYKIFKVYNVIIWHHVNFSFNMSGLIINCVNISVRLH